MGGNCWYVVAWVSARVMLYQFLVLHSSFTASMFHGPTSAVLLFFVFSNYYNPGTNSENYIGDEKKKALRLAVRCDVLCLGCR